MERTKINRTEITEEAIKQVADIAKLNLSEEDQRIETLKVISDVWRNGYSHGRSHSDEHCKAELYAAPVRYLLGAKPEDFKDKHGNPLKEFPTIGIIPNFYKEEEK